MNFDRVVAHFEKTPQQPKTIREYVMYRQAFILGLQLGAMLVTCVMTITIIVILL